MYIATYVFVQDINDSGQEMDTSEDDSGTGISLKVNSYVANMYTI